jgi:hypothetical protein
MAVVVSALAIAFCSCSLQESEDSVRREKVSPRRNFSFQNGNSSFRLSTAQKGEGARASAAGRTVEDLNVQVIRSYSWAAAESQKNSQCKPVNNCGGSRDFPETLVSSLERWQPATDCAADLLRMDLNDLSRRSSLQLIEQVGYDSG